MMVCKICLTEDVLASRAVRFAFSGPNATIEAYACERCLSNGRLTKVTCRNFSRDDEPSLSRKSDRMFSLPQIRT